MVLLDTGARPGYELLNLKWKQVNATIKPELNTSPTPHALLVDNDEGSEATITHDLKRVAYLSVSGKTGRRTISSSKRTITALKNIAKRNYQVNTPALHPLKNVAISTNEDFVFRLHNGKIPDRLEHLFQSYLEEHNLLIDPKSEQKRVLYCLRHTYATLSLTYDDIDIHTLALQMGTSTGMIEKFYSHVRIEKAREKLGREKSRKLLDENIGVSDAYKSKKQ
jgi:integrase